MCVYVYDETLSCIVCMCISRQSIHPCTCLNPRNGYFPPAVERRLGAIGLVPMDPFTDGWLIAGVPLFMTVRAGCFGLVR
jgi:hypothetical protein